MQKDHDDMAHRIATAKKVSPFLNTQMAAFYIQLSPSALAHMRCKGEGPPFHYHGRYVRYHIDDLDKWSRERRRNIVQRHKWHVA